jgi:hypothetical protein
MGQFVIIIDLFSMELYTCEQEYMRNILLKRKKCLLFKHEKNNQTLSND